MGNQSDDIDKRDSTRQALKALLTSGALRRQPPWASKDAVWHSSGDADKSADFNGEWTLRTESDNEPVFVEPLVETNLAGQVIRTRDAKGFERQFAWSEEGYLCEVRTTFGLWRSADGAVWVNTQGKSAKGVKRIDKDGSYMEEDDEWRRIYLLDGTHVEVHKPGGSQTVLFAEGHSLTQSAGEGQIRRIRQQDGSKYEYQILPDGRIRPVYNEFAQPVRLEIEWEKDRYFSDEIVRLDYQWLDDQSLLRLVYKASRGCRYIVDRGRHGDFQAFSKVENDKRH